MGISVFRGCRLGTTSINGRSWTESRSQDTFPLVCIQPSRGFGSNPRRLPSVHHDWRISAQLSVLVVYTLKIIRWTHVHWRHTQTPPVSWGKWKEVRPSSSVHLSQSWTANLWRKREREDQRWETINESSHTEAPFLQRMSKKCIINTYLNHNTIKL